MLIDFTVDNFRSIKEPATLSAVAQRAKTAAPTNADMKYITPDNEIAPPFKVEGWGFELLPALGIFGANASGKSNVIQALDCLLDLMRLGSASIVEYLKVMQPFMLDAATRTLPTRFELRVALEQKVYTYVLHITQERVTSESLHFAPAKAKRDILLYCRTWNADSKQYNWKNGKKFAGPHIQLEDSLADTDTFMSLLTRLNVTVTNPLNHWLMYRSVGTGHAFGRLDALAAARTAHESPEQLHRISTVVRLFDTGVLRFEVVKPGPEAGRPDGYETWAWHKAKDTEVKLPLSLESTGTQSLFGLANNLLKALDNATLLLVDELGSSLHPNITRQIVKLFQNPKTNPKRAQLVFASHDNTLQRRHLLRRDQIWFTQKDAEGRTTLYPLSDYKPRNDAAIDKAYLDGRYEAVPFLPDEEELAAITVGQREAA